MSKPESSPEPDYKGVFVIADLETLKVVADPLRLQVIEELRDAPSTVKEIAAVLGVSATRLYYHVNLLEQHGLLRVTETRLVSGILEKHYQTTADRISVDRALLGPDRPLQDEGVEVLLAVILDEARGEIRRSIRDGRIDVAKEAPLERGLVLGRLWARFTSDQARAYVDRFHELNDEFVQIAAGNDSDQQTYEILFGFYPVTRRANDEFDRADTSALAMPRLLVSDGDSET